MAQVSAARESGWGSDVIIVLSLLWVQTFKINKSTREAEERLAVIWLPGMPQPLSRNPLQTSGVYNLTVCQGNRKTVALSLGMQVTLNAHSEEKGVFITFIGIDKRALSTNTFSEYLGWAMHKWLRLSRKVLATGLCWYCIVFLVRWSRHCMELFLCGARDQAPPLTRKQELYH